MPQEPVDQATYGNTEHGEQFHTTWPLRIRCKELYKEKYGNFPNLVKNCLFARQASICLHVPKSSSKKGCMNLSLNSVFSKCTANSDFPNGAGTLSFFHNIRYTSFQK